MTIRDPVDDRSLVRCDDLATSLAEAALQVLQEPDPDTKASLTRGLAEGWALRRIPDIGRVIAPDRPARPEAPELRMPRDMPKRRSGGSAAGRIALLHALAHIELNAIDLAWDMIARFSDVDRAGAPLTKIFFTDWLQVANDEAVHFQLLQGRLRSYGSEYGTLPAHDGLWQAAADTAHDLAARLAVVPMVLEARGLDVTPSMIDNLNRAGDPESAAVLQRIHDDEISHVAVGRRWFETVCAHNGHDPLPTWQGLVRRYFTGVLKRPFNHASREKAGFKAAFYEPLADDVGSEAPASR